MLPRTDSDEMMLSQIIIEIFDITYWICEYLRFKWTSFYFTCYLLKRIDNLPWFALSFEERIQRISYADALKIPFYFII